MRSKKNNINKKQNKSKKKQLGGAGMAEMYFKSHQDARKNLQQAIRQEAPPAEIEAIEEEIKFYINMLDRIDQRQRKFTQLRPLATGDDVEGLSRAPVAEHDTARRLAIDLEFMHRRAMRMAMDQRAHVVLTHLAHHFLGRDVHDRLVLLAVGLAGLHAQ